MEKKFVIRTPIETLLAFIEAYNKQDADGLCDLMAIDFNRVSGSTKWKHMSKEMYRDMSRRWNEAFIDSKWELIDVLENGNTIVAEFFECGKFVKPYAINDNHVMQPNGKEYTARATVWFTFNQLGQIHTYRYYSDGGFGAAYGDVIAASGRKELSTPI